jgi:putative DNA primase/helicase
MNSTEIVEKPQTFYELAKPYAKMGIPCFPLIPKSKLPPEWMKDYPHRASHYLPQLAQWSQKMPDANVGLLGRDNQVGDIVFLEFDQGCLAEAAQEMGQPALSTRIHISGGKGLEHCLFKQTERSLNLGNRSANKGGKEWFSLRMHNRYVLGPGSIHPDSGRPYTVGADILPLDFPDWLVDWVEKYTVSEFSAAGRKDTPEVSEDFDFDKFREWLPFAINQDGNWYIVEFCPGVNRKHEHSTKTGLFFDGSRLCWKCFAQNCPCAYKEDGRKFTIGDLVRKIGEDVGAYDGAIWPQASVDELLDDFHAEDANIEPKPVTKSSGHDESQPKYKIGEYRFHTEKQPEYHATIVGIRMSDIRTEKLEWLWPDKIPAGNITLFGGQPGCGKSVVLLDIIARTTTGRNWADGSRNTAGPRDVLLLASEDGEADTIKPRLIAAGADMQRIIVIRRVLLEPPDGDKEKGKSKHAFQLDTDTFTLKDALKANPNVALVALDPISAFFGDCDPNKDKEIRPVMEAIADAMEGSKCAFVGIIHNNKGPHTDSISKILGASSVVGVARAVWGFGYDADDKTLRHMLLVKGNLSEKRAGLSYRLVNAAIKLDDGEEDGQPVCDWQGETDEDADDLLAKKREKAKNGGVELKSDAAQMMLKRALANGWRLLRDLHHIREKEGISESTMKRARYALGIISTKSAPWMWAMPGTPAPEDLRNWVEDHQVPDQEVM